MQRIADYEFVRPVGAGNHGRFFLAKRPPRLPVDAEHVAVKGLSGRSTARPVPRATPAIKAFAAARSPLPVTRYDPPRPHGILSYPIGDLAAGSLAESPTPV